LQGVTAEHAGRLYDGQWIAAALLFWSLFFALCICRQHYFFCDYVHIIGVCCSVTLELALMSAVVSEDSASVFNV